MYYFSDFFSTWLPSHEIPKDVLTWKAIEDLKADLSRDFKERKKYLEGKLLEIVKAQKDWQKQETTQEIPQ